MTTLNGQRLAKLMLGTLNILRSNKLAGESYKDAFLRIAGITPNVDILNAQITSGDGSQETETQLAGIRDTAVVTGQRGSTLIDGFLKSETSLRQLCGEYIARLIDIVDSWKRCQYVQQSRRLQRLVGDGTEGVISPVDNIDLHVFEENAKDQHVVKVNIEDVVKKVNTTFKEIDSSQIDKSVGQLTLKQSVLDTLTTQITMLISSIPTEDLGEFGGVFIKTIKAPSAGLEKQGRRLGTQRQAVEIELRNLQQQAKLIIDGLLLDGEKISLKQILSALSYLCTGVEYKCKNCKFFEEDLDNIKATFPDIVIRGEAKDSKGICKFAINENSALATNPGDTCKETWGLTRNDYWTASVEIAQKVLDILQELEKE